MYFLHLNFPNAQGILVQKLYNAHANCCQSSDIKSGGQSQQPNILSFGYQQIPTQLNEYAFNE